MATCDQNVLRLHAFRATKHNQTVMKHPITNMKKKLIAYTTYHLYVTFNMNANLQPYLKV